MKRFSICAFFFITLFLGGCLLSSPVSAQVVKCTNADTCVSTCPIGTLTRGPCAGGISGVCCTAPSATACTGACESGATCAGTDTPIPDQTCPNMNGSAATCCKVNTTAGTGPINLTAPDLNVKIPGLVFATQSDVVNNKISIPFLAQYITAVYKLLLSISIIAAAVMIVYGGFKYVLSANIQSVQDGKEEIQNAIIGLVVIFASYTILQALSPAAVSLTSINVDYIKPDPLASFEYAQLSTKADTQDAPGASIVNTSPDCPFTLTNPLATGMLPPVSSDPRSLEFFDKVKAVITGSSVSERIQQAGDAAAKCNVHLGYCGQVTGTIYTLAGVVNDPSCLTSKAKDVCHPQDDPKQAKQIHYLTNAQMLYLIGLRCDHQNCCPPGNTKCKEYPADSDCVKTQGEALTKARQFIADGVGNGYPDSWTNDLLPGDFLQVYNGNDSCGSGHSILFLGWGDGGNAKVVTGQWGQSVKFGTQCLKKGSCNGGNFLPLVRVFRPNAR